MIFNSEVNFGDLVKMTKNGVVVASFPKILSMLKKRYKEVYGSDINVDATTADGIWLHDISLLINNILQTMQMLYANLDVNSATGVYLENICKLANVSRKSATPSRAEVTITNIGSSAISTTKGIICLDREGREWSTEKNITLESNESVVLTLTCNDVGEIKAVAGSIYQVINTDSNILLSVYQGRDAVVGTNAESDADLRARKNQSNSPIGVTILESLQGALLEQTGVRDSLIINNWRETNYTTYKGYDHTTIGAHSIYIVLKTIDEMSEDIKNAIGETVYNKLTPGIATTIPGYDNDGTWTNPDGGEIVEVNYFPSIYGISYEGFDVNIYWKKATPIAPTIEVTLNPKSYYTPEERQEVAENFMSYLNSLPLNTDLIADELKLKVMELDPTFKGVNTYSVSDLSITGADVSTHNYTNPLTYYEYNTITLGTEENINKFTLSRV